MEKTYLQKHWEAVLELHWEILAYGYIDDQPEMDIIYDIVSDMIQYLKQNHKPDVYKNTIMKDLADHDYFEYYGFEESMRELYELCKE